RREPEPCDGGCDLPVRVRAGTAPRCVAVATSLATRNTCSVARSAPVRPKAARTSSKEPSSGDGVPPESWGDRPMMATLYQRGATKQQYVRTPRPASVGSCDEHPDHAWTIRPGDPRGTARRRGGRGPRRSRRGVE